MARTTTVPVGLGQRAQSLRGQHWERATLRDRGLVLRGLALLVEHAPPRHGPVLRDGFVPLLEPNIVVDAIRDGHRSRARLVDAPESARSEIRDRNARPVGTFRRTSREGGDRGCRNRILSLPKALARSWARSHHVKRASLRP